MVLLSASPRGKKPGVGENSWISSPPRGELLCFLKAAGKQQLRGSCTVSLVLVDLEQSSRPAANPSLPS